MIRLAEATGGRAFYFTNGLQQAVQNAVSDAAVSYTLGFYPGDGAFDGKYHNLRVKVDRSGVEIRHRQGYEATKDEPPNADQRQVILRDLLQSPLDASQIGLTATTKADPVQPRVSRVEVTIDAHDVRFERKDDHWTGTLDLAIRTESSTESVVKIKTIPINLTEERFQTSMRRGLYFEEVVTTTRPNEHVRVVVQDRATGLAGSLWIPLQ